MPFRGLRLSPARARWQGLMTSIRDPNCPLVRLKLDLSHVTEAEDVCVPLVQGLAASFQEVRVNGSAHATSVSTHFSMSAAAAACQGDVTYVVVTG